VIYWDIQKKNYSDEPWDELTHPDDIAANLNLFQRALDGEIDSYEMDKRFIHKDDTQSTQHFVVCLRQCRRLGSSFPYIVSGYNRTKNI
jgi:hypothetical protein